MYSPDEGNPHTLVTESRGVYSTNIYCPATERDKKQFGYLLSIHCSRQKFEYSDFFFTFDNDILETKLENSLKKITTQSLLKKKQNLMKMNVNFYI